MAAACVTAVLLRVAYALTSAQLPGGDQGWFLETARAYARMAPHEAPDVSFGRVPLPGLLYALPISAGVLDDALAVRVFQALAAGLTVWLAARVAERAIGGRGSIVGLAVAWSVALDPLSIRMAANIHATSLIPLFGLAWMHLLLGTGRMPAPNLRVLTGIGLAAAAAIHVRIDFIVEVVAGCVATAWARIRRERSLRSVVVWTLPVVVAAAALAPWVAYSRAHQAHPSGADEGTAANWMFYRWCSTYVAPRGEWLSTVWHGAAKCPEDERPYHWLADEEEVERLSTLYDAARDPARRADVDLAFGEWAEERIAADPVRFHVTYPALRTLNLMFDVTDSDIPARVTGPRTGGIGRAKDLVFVLQRGVYALGFVLAFWWALRRRDAVRIIALIVVARVVFVGFVGQWWMGRALYHARYLTTARVLVLILLGIAATEWWHRRRRQRSAAPSPTASSA